MTEEEKDIFLVKVNEIAQKLTITLYKEAGEQISPTMMMYVAATFSAAMLLSIQKKGELESLADDYNLLVKKIIGFMKQKAGFGIDGGIN